MKPPDLDAVDPDWASSAQWAYNGVSFDPGVWMPSVSIDVLLTRSHPATVPKEVGGLW